MLVVDGGDEGVVLMEEGNVGVKFVAEGVEDIGAKCVLGEGLDGAELDGGAMDVC